MQGRDFSRPYNFIRGNLNAPFRRVAQQIIAKFIILLYNKNKPRGVKISLFLERIIL